ncbi:MAG: carbon-nitrogen hydrolase family protein [Rhodospirillales bacterium]|nr:carbon-nitrogen hydrolase family protein [Rhodospirillales bacterium]
MSGVAWTLAVVQMDCATGDTEGNLATIARFAGEAAIQHVDLVVFPECATTGYFLGDRLADLAEPPDGPSARRLGEIARENGLTMAVGAYTQRDGGIYDSQLLFGPDGECLAVYDKAHLFASERESCRAGDSACVVETRLGRVGMTVCYDFIFADYVRRLGDLGADLIVNSTNWIADDYQQETWGWSGPVTQGLAATRALENGTFVAMANRVGEEQLAPGLSFTSLGHSCIAGPSGKILAALTEGEGLAVARIDIAQEDLDRWRAIATYRADRRPELTG